MAIVCNQVNVVGRLNRMDVRKGIAKTGNEFVSVTFTLQVGDTQLKIENFSMKNKKDGSELSSYQGLMTLYNEAKALHKTMREVGAEKADEVQDETIVENIDECDAIRFSNYGNFKYCRIEENSYVKDGELVKNLRLAGASPNRVDETKKEYVPTADFEVAGVITTHPVAMEKDEVEFMQFKAMIPVYTEAYGDREAKVDLVEMTLRLNDESAFGYVEDEFTIGSFVSLNGTIVREVKRIELDVPMENEGRGFGRQIEHKAQYRTEIEEYYNLLGGFVLEEEEVENTPALSMDLWAKAKEEQSQKEQEMLEQQDRPKAVFGRANETKKENKPNKPVLPF